jgi:DNA-binding GntR family transcriptional regulator
MSEAAYRQLRAEILSCRLTPGRRLTEKQLAADTGFGVSPIRDALTRLDQQGLIRTLPRKGYQVTPLTLKLVDDLFGMWLIVGPELVRLGVARASDEQLARARAGFGALAEAGPGTSTEDLAVRIIDLSAGVFRILALATDNDYLISLFDQIAGDMTRVWVFLLEADPEGATIAVAQTQISQLLSGRDPDMAAANARRYIADAHERVLRAIMRWPSVMSTELVALRS